MLKEETKLLLSSAKKQLEVNTAMLKEQEKEKLSLLEIANKQSAMIKHLLKMLTELLDEQRRALLKDQQE